MRYIALGTIALLTACQPDSRQPDLTIHNTDDELVRIAKVAAQNNRNAQFCQNRDERAKEPKTICGSIGNRRMSGYHDETQMRMAIDENTKSECSSPTDRECISQKDDGEAWASPPAKLDQQLSKDGGLFLPSAQVTPYARQLFPDWASLVQAVKTRGGQCENGTCEAIVPIKHEYRDATPDCWYNSMLFLHFKEDKSHAYDAFVYYFGRSRFLPKDYPYRGVDPRRYYQLYDAHQKPCQPISYWENVGPMKRSPQNLRD